jgi:hypothetical protein
MPRRIGLGASAELLATGNGESSGNGREQSAAVVTEALTRRSSGRVRHEEKITVYVSAEELLALEQARLILRARHGMAADRGRIVREAIAAILADLEARGDDSELVHRLSVS